MICKVLNLYQLSNQCMIVVVPSMFAYVVSVGLTHTCYTHTFKHTFEYRINQRNIKKTTTQIMMKRGSLSQIHCCILKINPIPNQAKLIQKNESKQGGGQSRAARAIYAFSDRVLAPIWPKFVPSWRNFNPSWLHVGPSRLRFGLHRGMEKARKLIHSKKEKYTNCVN